MLTRGQLIGKTLNSRQTALGLMPSVAGMTQIHVHRSVYVQKMSFARCSSIVCVLYQKIFVHPNPQNKTSKSLSRNARYFTGRIKQLLLPNFGNTGSVM